jgi:hypothetical protein
MAYPARGQSSQGENGVVDVVRAPRRFEQGNRSLDETKPKAAWTDSHTGHDQAAANTNDEPAA